MTPMLSEAELDKLSLDQIRDLALASTTPDQPAVEEEPAQPAPDTKTPLRDAHGRFVSAAEEQVEEAPAEESDEQPVEETPETTLFRREIDLHDGAGVQVFEAPTMEELVDKLVEAQRHATRKIREFNQVVKQVPQAPQPRQLTPDEKYVISQQFQTEPEKAFEAIFEAQTGMKMADFRRMSAENQQRSVAEANDRVSRQWVSSTPDYYPSASNGSKMQAYINKFHGGIATPENLTEAYNDLKVSGLLQAKPAPPPQTPAQPAAPAPVRRASGLSTRRSAPPTPPKQGHTLEEAETMPLDQLRRLANGGKEYGGW